MGGKPYVIAGLLACATLLPGCGKSNPTGADTTEGSVSQSLASRILAVSYNKGDVVARILPFCETFDGDQTHYCNAQFSVGVIVDMAPEVFENNQATFKMKDKPPYIKSGSDFGSEDSLEFAVRTSKGDLEFRDFGRQGCDQPKDKVSTLLWEPGAYSMSDPNCTTFMNRTYDLIFKALASGEKFHK